jgi:hypothetical protein
MWLKIGRVKALFKEPKKLIETSGSESAYELYQRRNSSPRLKRLGYRGIIAAATQQKKGEKMKKVLLSIALAMVASLAWGQTTRQPLMNERQVPQQQTTTTTTTTTEGTGTITEYTPGSAIVLRETSGPVRYRFGKTVTYVTRSGRVLDEATMKSRIRVGVPVRVHYAGTGPSMVVDRVILEED